MDNPGEITQRNMDNSVVPHYTQCSPTGATATPQAASPVRWFVTTVGTNGSIHPDLNAPDRQFDSQDDLARASHHIRPPSHDVRSGGPHFVTNVNSAAIQSLVLPDLRTIKARLQAVAESCKALRRVPSGQRGIA